MTREGFAASPTSRGLREPGDVVREPDEEEEQHDREPDHGDALVDLAPDETPARALDEREQDMAAVEREEREQVHERQRQRDQREYPEVAVRALPHGVRGRLRDADRARHVLAPAPGREAAERASDLRRDVA